MLGLWNHKTGCCRSDTFGEIMYGAIMTRRQSRYPVVIYTKIMKVYEKRSHVWSHIVAKRSCLVSYCGKKVSCLVSYCGKLHGDNKYAIKMSVTLLTIFKIQNDFYATLYAIFQSGKDGSCTRKLSPALRRSPRKKGLHPKFDCPKKH